MIANVMIVAVIAKDRLIDRDRSSSIRIYQIVKMSVVVHVLVTS